MAPYELRSSNRIGSPKAKQADPFKNKVRHLSTKLALPNREKTVDSNYLTVTIP